MDTYFHRTMVFYLVFCKIGAVKTNTEKKLGSCIICKQINMKCLQLMERPVNQMGENYFTSQEKTDVTHNL